MLVKIRKLMILKLASGDGTIDKLHFIDVARVIAVPLASRGYLAATDPCRTRLLIMAYWGTTAVPGPPSDSTAYSQFGAAQGNLKKAMFAAAHPGSNKGKVDLGDLKSLGEVAEPRK